MGRIRTIVTGFHPLMQFRLQEIAWHHGRNVLAGTEREYGHARVHVEKHQGEALHVDKLFNGLGSELEVYMSHGKKNSRTVLEDSSKQLFFF